MSWLAEWRCWIREVTMAIYGLLLIIALAFTAIELQKSGSQTHVLAWFLGGLFVLFGIPISLWGILQHLVYYDKPILQRHIVRILWMVPIYATDAWLALRFPEAAIYLDTIRECYEAYVIYSFMCLLFAYLELEYPGQLEERASGVHRLMFPLCFLPSVSGGRSFLRLCKHGVLQYTVVRPITTILALICEWADVYGDGELSPKKAFIYFLVINNLSQLCAMYCLVLFYKDLRKDLAPLKPVLKLLCVKAVVFLSFWQASLISVLRATRVIPDSNTWISYDSGKVASGIQDFCICVEMFFAAVAHHFAFSHLPYVDSQQTSRNLRSCWYSFMNMWDVSDVRDDVIQHVRVVGGTVKKVIRRLPQRAAAGESTALLADQHQPSERASLLSRDDAQLPPPLGSKYGTDNSTTSALHVQPPPHTDGAASQGTAEQAIVSPEPGNQAQPGCTASGSHIPQLLQDC